MSQSSTIERASKWMPQPEIDCGCADISFKWRSRKDAALVIVMHFSRMVGGLERNLELTFTNPLAVRWEEEHCGLIEGPANLPKCSNGQFVHPTLIIENSAWRKAYVDRLYSAGDPQSKDVRHYFFLSLNDLLHVLADGEPVVRWIASASG
jgi:hypothetical protein